MVGMIGLTRWLTGWVEFSIQGKKKGQAERFLTLSARSGFCFWGMEPEGEGFRCRVRAVEYPELRSGARRCGVRLRVLRRRGLPFWQQKLCRRKGLALGGAIFCLLLWFLSGRFWIITVSGNEELPQSLLLSAAQEEGLFSGVARDSIDEKVLAAALMERFPEIGWVSVNTRNCQAEICLEEGVPKPEDQSGETPANILAAADGQILSIDAFDGVAMVKAGDTVVEGQVLISGIREDQLGVNHAIHARGQVEARTRRSFTAEIPLEYTETVETGETLIRRSLTAFGLTFPLTLRREPEGLWRREDNRYTASLLGTPLPLWVQEETWLACRQEKRQLTREEAEALAWDAVSLQQRELLGARGRVLEEESSSKVENGVLRLTVRAQCREEIGVTREIIFE